MYRIAVFASGSGTNAENLIRHFNSQPSDSAKARVDLVVCNKENAYVLPFGLAPRIDYLKIVDILISKEEEYAKEKKKTAA